MQRYYSKMNKLTINTFDDMIGKTLSSITGDIGDYEFILEATDGTILKFFHDQDCCEYVLINDIIGDVKDLIGYPLLEAEEITSEGYQNPESDDYTQWTFYRFSTVQGTITVRWLGSSNGYYSTDVTYKLILPQDDRKYKNA